MGISAVKGFTKVKNIKEASVNIWRRCAVVTVVRVDHFFLKFRTSRRKMVFSAVNSREAAHVMRDSMLCSILNSSACIDAFGLSSLLNKTCGDFLEPKESSEVNDAVVVDDDTEVRREVDLYASRSGINRSTC